jgi:exodeoxyribonuclease VII small subunit
MIVSNQFLLLPPMPKAKATASADTTIPLPPSYEAAVAELEALLARLDAGALPLDQILSGYQRGTQLLAFCRQKLEAVEDQIKVLDQGVIKPWKP